jgi:hypothetical protein
MPKRAFIAAPLLGTLIFLISIIVVINMQKAESAAVAETVSDAYHNKLVSMVEIYRSDLGSLFNIGLQRNIEYALTSQCWSNFVTLSTDRKVESGNNDCFDYRGQHICQDMPDAGGIGDGISNEQEQRLYTCGRASQLMKEVVCSTNTNYLFTLPSWASIITNKTNFEGISLEAANEEDFLRFIGATAYAENGTDLCRQLLSGIELDCNYFSNPPDPDSPFQCCTKFDAVGNCDPSTIVHGACDSGNQFLIRIAVQNDAVYRSFPRVLAKDTSGNQIRAGAITDVDYDAPITYPFFKYLDEAFKFNKYLAFGKDRIDARSSLGTDVGAQRGIVEGSCEGGDLCLTKNMPTGDYGSPFSDDTAALNAYAQTFFNGPLKDACDGARAKTIETNFSINSQPVSCEELQGKYAEQPSQALFSIDSANNGGAPSTSIAYSLPQSALKVVFVDPDLTTQVRPFSSNEFCWYSSSTYSPPT